MSYGKPKKIAVHINRTEEGTYEIPEEDLRALDQTMISQEKLGQDGSETVKKEADETEKLE